MHVSAVLALVLAFATSASAEFTFMSFDVPGVTGATEPLGINGPGQIVGSYFDPRSHGFVKDGAGFTTIDVPGAVSTTAQGINDAGQIVGSYSNPLSGPRRGFFDAGGMFMLVDVPGALSNDVSGINA